MLKGSIYKLATLGIFSAMTMPAAATQPVNPNVIFKVGSYSKLSTEQLREKKNSRIYLSQDVARTISSDPLFPYRSRPLYSFIGYEYFPTPQISLGAVAVYTYEKDEYSRPTNALRSNTIANVSGILPYISYLIKPQWLITAQAGGYIEDYKGTSVSTVGTTNNIRNQVFTPHAGAYLTWIGPDTTYSATIRSGAYYTNQRFRSTIDSNGRFSPTRHLCASGKSA